MRRELAREPSIDCGSEGGVLVLRTRAVIRIFSLTSSPHPLFTRWALRETIGLSQPQAAGSPHHAQQSSHPSRTRKTTDR